MQRVGNVFIISFSFTISVIALVISIQTNILLFSQAVVASSPQALGKKPVRRVLLVGISNYDRAKGKQPVGRGKNAAPANAKTVLDPLSGPPNDVKEMAAVLSVYCQYVHILPEEEATHDGILKAIQKYLIDDAAPGDQCLFYFSGHGSYIRNSLSPTKQEETIVPLDYLRPILKREDIRDIRDRELMQYFNRALDKGVTLTAIFDSCHSGSIARGGEITKAAPGSDFDLAEPPPNMPKPGDRGALIVHAALAHQQALINEYNGVPYSDFTHALMKVLTRQSAETLTAEQLFQQVATTLRGTDKKAEPGLDTNPTRLKLNLFGSPLPPDSQRQLFVIRKLEADKKLVMLDQGRAFGLTPGSILVKREEPVPDAQKLRLEITRVLDMTSSFAKPVVATDFSKLKQGDVFELEKWATSPESLNVCLPPALSLDAIRKVARELAQLRQSDRVHWIEDPTEEMATHRVYYDGKSWKLMLPSGASEDLGAMPKAAAILAKSGGKTGERISLWISLPLASELKNGLGQGTNTAVNLVSSEAAATYQLSGRALGGGEEIEYAWVRTGAIKTETEMERNARLAGKPVAPAKPSPLPPLTDWVRMKGQPDESSERLTELALKLNKIYGWVNLTSPVEAGKMQKEFPYHLEILDQNKAPLQPAADGKTALLEDEFYKVALVPNDPKRLSSKDEKYWVYVLSIDKNGESSLLYPSGNIGSEKALLQESGKPFPLEILTEKMTVVGPKKGGVLGPETYILLITSERLANPLALQFKGVRSAAAARSGGVSPLEELLNDIGLRSRAPSTPVPATWSVQHVFLESRPK